MLNLFKKSGPSPVTQFTVSSTQGMTAGELMEKGTPAAIHHALRFEINQAGGEIFTFLMLERAYRRSPTLDGLGLLMSTFVSLGSELELNIDNNDRASATNAIKNFYAGRRTGVTLQQFKSQRPPTSVFQQCAQHVETTASSDILFNMKSSGALVQDGTTVKMFPFTLNSEGGMTSGRVLKCRTIRAVAGAAMKFGLNPPSSLLSVSC